MCQIQAWYCGDCTCKSTAQMSNSLCQWSDKLKAPYENRDRRGCFSAAKALPARGEATAVVRRNAVSKPPTHRKQQHLWQQALCLA